MPSVSLVRRMTRPIYFRTSLAFFSREFCSDCPALFLFCQLPYALRIRFGTGAEVLSAQVPLGTPYVRARVTTTALPLSRAASVCHLSLTPIARCRRRWVRPSCGLLRRRRSPGARSQDATGVRVEAVRLSGKRTGD